VFHRNDRAGLERIVTVRLSIHGPNSN
jgi:hypothetical protein